MAYADDVLATTPLRYWPLDETSGTNANEVVANDDGTAHGITMGGADAPLGIGGKCPTFTGATTEYITLKAAAILGGLSAWSISAWVLYSATGTGVCSFYGEKGTTGNDLVRAGLSGASSSSLNIAYGNDSGNANYASNSTFIRGAWYLVTMTRTGSSYGCWYAGGRRLSGTNFASSNTWTNTGVESRVGTLVGAGNPWIGRVAQLCLHNRVLTEAEIVSLYESGTPLQRDLADRNWWAPHSPWNQLLTDPDNPPVIASNSSDLVTKLVAQTGLSAPAAASAQPLFVVDDSTPTEIVRMQGGQNNVSTDKPYLWDAMQAVPIPTGFLPDTTTTDKGATIWNSDTDEYWDFWIMEHALKSPNWVTAATQIETAGTLPAGNYGIYVAAVADDDGIGNFKGLTAANTNGTNPPYIADGTHAVRIVWEAVEGAVGYNVYVSATGSGFATARLVGTVDEDTFGYTYTGSPFPGTNLMTSEAIGVTTDWGCSYGGYIDGTDDNPGIWLPPRANWGATATSLPNWAGTISLNEALAAREGDVDAIGHAINGALLQSTDTHVFPAQRHDFFGGPYAIPEGTRFQLDPAFDVMTIANPFVRAVARAYQDYGYIIRDKSGGISVAPVENANATGRNFLPYVFSGAQGYELFTGFPWSQMRVIDPNWTLEQTVIDAEPLAEIATLSDGFDTAPIDAAKWSATGTTNLAAGQIHVPMVGTVYSGLTSVASYDFSDSAISFQVVQLTRGNGADQAGFRLISDVDAANCWLYFWVDAGSAISAAYKNPSGQYIRVGGEAGGISYDSVAHAWWRMREAAGIVYWDFSINGVEWTEWRSLIWATTGWSPSALTSMKAQFVAGNYNSVAGRPDLIIDNVNTVAVVPPTLTVAPTSLSFVAVEGDPSPAPKTALVTNAGEGTLDITVSDDASWLTVTPSSPTVPVTLSIWPNAGVLTAGTYTATVTITATTPGAVGSPKTIVVTFVVTALAPAGEGTFTIAAAPWPDGTVVNVYAAAGWTQPDRSAPSGVAVATAVVANGSVSFTGLATEVRYVAYALGHGVTFLVKPPIEPNLRAATGWELLETLEEQLTALQAEVDALT